MSFNIEGLKYTVEKISKEKVSKIYLNDASSKDEEDEEDKKGKKRAFVDFS